VTGATEEQYLAAFDRRNLVEGEWSVRAARKAADAMEIVPGSDIVLLGHAVRTAFRLPERLIHPYVDRDATWRQIPHPSGLSRFYNSPTQRRLVALLLRDLYLKEVNQ
jgi:hypothetical protein